MFLSTVLLLVLFMSDKITGRIHEPSCTYMDNLEKILEKLVRNEIKLGSFGDKLDEKEFTLREKLLELDTSEAVRTRQVEDVVAKVEEMQQTLTDTSTNIQKTLADDLKKHDAALQSSKGPVVFMAKHLSTTSPAYNGPMVFTQVDTNVGNGYDSSTGIFTAPVAGTYSFNVQFCATNNNYAVVALFVNGVHKTSMLTYGNGGHTCRTLTYPAVLKQGDKVQVKADPDRYSSPNFQQDSKYRINSFSGALFR